MSEFKVIEIKKSVFENNDREADKVREGQNLFAQPYVIAGLGKNNNT